jgi:carnitine 3-dehydrogenase
MLAQFGPCLKWPWTKLEAPELTETLIDRMVEGTQAEAAGRSIRDLERLRDDYLVAIQQVLRQYNIGAGATLRALEERLYQDAAQGRGGFERGQDPELPLVRTTVRPEWVDYNGHMSDFRYAQVFGDAMDALYRRVGVDAAYRAAGRMFYTVESHIVHFAEVRAEEPIETSTRILGLDDKRLHVSHQMHRARDGALLASGEQLHLHVATAAARASPMDASVRARLESLRDRQAVLPAPPPASRRIDVGNRAVAAHAQDR